MDSSDHALSKKSAGIVQLVIPLAFDQFFFADQVGGDGALRSGQIGRVDCSRNTCYFGQFVKHNESKLDEGGMKREDNKVGNNRRSKFNGYSRRRRFR